MVKVPAPLRLLIDRDALVANWRWLAGRSGKAACGAAIKANGYGLGAKPVFKHLYAAGCRDFFVATWAEAAALGTLPDDAQLSVLHGVRAEDIGFTNQIRARPVLNSIDQVRRWQEAGGGVCHVMLDTGMNRLGLTPEQACSGLLDGVKINTLLSHLASADEPTSALTAHQRAEFAQLSRLIPAERYSLANSAGIMMGGDYAFDLTRPGIALYGGIPLAQADGHIRPVVQPQAQILQIRAVSAGETIGYGETYRAQRDMLIAILNIGYADGYLRCWSNMGEAMIHGETRPVLGRVSMDMTAIDVTAVDAREGDWVSLRYDLPEAAKASGLSQYELLTGLGQRFDRVWQ